jgi:tRNA (mo5U34)-methyltransferase
MNTNHNIQTMSLPPEPEHWFHSFAFPDGAQVNGIKPLSSLLREADTVLGDNLSGKRVLDIGAWDGFFPLKRRSAGPPKY